MKIYLNFAFFFLTLAVSGGFSARICAQTPENSDVQNSESQDFDSEHSFGEKRPRVGDFLLSAGIAPEVSFEAWDAKNERFLFSRGGKQFAFEPAEFLCWGGITSTHTSDFALQLSNGGLFAGLPVFPAENASEERISAENQHSEDPSGKKRISGEKRLEENSLSGENERSGENTHSEETLTLETRFCGTLSFSYEELSALVFPGTDRAAREKILLEARREKCRSDVLILRTGERVEGEFLTLTPETAVFRTRTLSPDYSDTFMNKNQTLRIVHKNISAVLFSKSMQKNESAESPRKYFWLGLSDGSLFPAEVSGTRPPLDVITRNAVIYVESPQKSQRFFASSITAAAENIPELQWLDELEPSEVRRVSPLGESGILPPWNTAASAEGSPLSVRGRQQRHGFGVTPGVTLIWKLDGSMKTFAFIPAIDDASRFSDADANHSVLFRVFTDGVLQKEISCNSVSALRLEKVGIENAHELTLTVEAVSAESHTLPQLLYADWLNAFLEPVKTSEPQKEE